MKDSWKFWVNKDGSVFGGKYYYFKTFKVYWAYRWFVAKSIDHYMSITPIKTLTGEKIELTNYADKY